MKPKCGKVKRDRIETCVKCEAYVCTYVCREAQRSQRFPSLNSMAQALALPIQNRGGEGGGDDVHDDNMGGSGGSDGGKDRDLKGCATFHMVPYTAEDFQEQQQPRALACVRTLVQCYL